MALKLENRIANLEVALGVERSRGDEYQQRAREAERKLKMLAEMLFEYCPLERYAEATKAYEELGLDD